MDVVKSAEHLPDYDAASAVGGRVAFAAEMLLVFATISAMAACQVLPRGDVKARVLRALDRTLSWALVG
jgi:hypothetical protein